MSEDGFCNVEGGRLYYEVDGGGHPLVLIHAGIANLRMWDPQVPAFSERYRVIRYDTRGFGRTTSEDVPFSNRQDLADLLDHLGVDSAYLVGCSRGGQIAVDFTLERPERVDALVTVASGPGGREERDVPDDIPPLWDEMERLHEAEEWARLAELETAFWVDGYRQPADRVDPRIRRDALGWILESLDAHGHEHAQPQPLDPPAAGRLDAIGVPTLVTSGELDNPVDSAGSAALAQGIPGAQRFTFKGAAHLPNLEQPDLFTRTVLDFLAEVDPRRPATSRARSRR
jgi:3-oxoadipate enol-lactonase